MTFQAKTTFGVSRMPWLLGIACIITIFCDSLSSLADPVSVDGLRWTNNDLIGPVHMVRVTASDLYQTGNEWLEKSSDYEWVATYDRAKLVVEKEHLHPIVKPPLSPKTFTCLARDPNGKIVQAFACNPERSPIDDFRYVFLYNSDGQLAEQLMVHLDEIPSLERREVYEYEAGQKVAEREYDSHGALKRLITIDRDSETNTLTVYAGTGEGDPWSKSRHILDSMGHRLESISLGPNDEILSRSRMAYDSHGNCTERISSGRGSEFREVILYEYDRWGNWTQKTSHTIQADTESRRITRRTIEYFPD